MSASLQICLKSIDTGMRRARATRNSSWRVWVTLTMSSCWSRSHTTRTPRWCTLIGRATGLASSLAISAQVQTQLAPLEWTTSRKRSIIQPFTALTLERAPRSPERAERRGTRLARKIRIAKRTLEPFTNHFDSFSIR